MPYSFVPFLLKNTYAVKVICTCIIAQVVVYCQ
nr:MAG TPA: hypothetical protein [Caudoviricetes sp.]